jgi:uncharacterized protein (DUF736 family)
MSCRTTTRIPTRTTSSSTVRMRIGVAWNQEDDRGFYKSIVFEEPSLAPGFYTLVKTVVEKEYELRYRNPIVKKA